ncbi:MAG: hypothetical protein GX437_07330 [Sphingobacteriales bacterium]|nr:hypothetical protein [Sphingobacteriales bacterium]
MYETKKNAQLRIGIILLIIIVINILFSLIYFRLDFTADKRYTLSTTTKNVLKELKAPVTVTAYFSDKLPPDVLYIKNDFRDLLTEYASYSRKKVVWSFMDPSKDPRVKQKALQKGIQPMLLNIRKKDKFQQQEVFMGALVQYGEKFEVIPAIQPGAPMEYALTFAINKCSKTEKALIGLVQGQGEAQLKDISYLQEILSDLYQFEEFTLTDTSVIPSRYKAIAIINPTDSFTEKQLKELDGFMGAGGRLLLAYGLVKGDLSQMPPMANLNATGIENWLKTYGIELLPDMVYDLQSSQITVQQRQGNYIINTPVDFFYIPFFSNFADHPVTKGLESMILPFVSEIKINSHDTNIKITPLLMSSDKAGSERVPFYIDLTKQWSDNDFNRSSIPVAVAVEGSRYGNHKAKMIIITNGDFFLNDEQGRLQGAPDNLNFIAGAIDWISDESGLAELRTKTIQTRPLRQISESRKNFIKYLNVVSPILIVILYGILRWRNQNRKRKQFLTEI